MAVEKYTEIIPTIGAGPGPIERGSGNFLLVLSATANVTVSLIRSGMMERYTGIAGGLILQRVKPWENLRIDGPAGTSVTFHYGNEITPLDVTDIRLQVATLTGVSLVSDSPAAAANDTANVAVGNAAQTAVFAANPNRRRIKVSFASNAAIPPATVFFRKAGGANNILEVQPGAVYPFDGTYGIDVRNDSGGALTALVFEEQ